MPCHETWSVMSTGGSCLLNTEHNLKAVLCSNDRVAPKLPYCSSNASAVGTESCTAPRYLAIQVFKAPFNDRVSTLAVYLPGS